MATFGSLFSGIGGCDLGLQRAGWQCKWQVEIDPYRRAVLAKHWPDVKRHNDVKECGKENLEAVTLICGGFPCQPHSIAGKRRGAEDDRNLWPEMLRVIDELRPTWALAENVLGIRTTILDTVLSDLERMGYSTGAIVVPAVAFDAQHRRDRFWIMAHTTQQENGRRRDSGRRQDPRADRAWAPSQFGRSGQTISNAAITRPQKRQGIQSRRQETNTTAMAHLGWAPEPDVGRVVNGLPATLDGIGVENAHRQCYQKARATGDHRIGRVRTVWCNGESATPPSTTDGERCVMCGHPLSELPYGGSLTGWLMETGGEGDEGLRDLWSRVFQLQPQQGQDLWAELFERAGAAQRIQAMASRVNRIRALGDAVVPQVVEWIGRYMLEIENGKRAERDA